jgi:hypothetical protein
MSTVNRTWVDSGQSRLGGRSGEGLSRIMSATFAIREEPTMSTIKISADQLRPGDVVSYGGHWHRVTNVVRRAGGSWPVAVDGTGWAIALGNRPLSVRRGERVHRRLSASRIG